MTTTDQHTRPVHASGSFSLDGRAVHRLGFGAMRITGTGIWGEPTDRAECVRTVRRAVELGVDLIDTADSYGPEVSERLIADTLYPYPEELVIATKGGLVRLGQADRSGPHAGGVPDGGAAAVPAPAAGGRRQPAMNTASHGS